MQFNPDLTAVPFPPISTVKGWIAGRTFTSERPLVDLCQAVPDFPPAPELVAHLRDLVGVPEVARYTPDEGLAEVRTAVADMVKVAERLVEVMRRG